MSESERSAIPKRYRWAKVDFDLAVEFTRDKLPAEPPPHFNRPETDSSSPAMLAFGDGSIVLAYSRYYSQYFNSWPKSPEFWIGEPDGEGATDGR